MKFGPDELALETYPDLVIVLGPAVIVSLVALAGYAVKKRSVRQRGNDERRGDT